MSFVLTIFSPFFCFQKSLSLWMALLADCCSARYVWSDASVDGNGL